MKIFVKVLGIVVLTLLAILYFGMILPSFISSKDTFQVICGIGSLAIIAVIGISIILNRLKKK